jgi:periplasmic binding family protein
VLRKMTRRKLGGGVPVPPPSLFLSGDDPAGAPFIAAAVALAYGLAGEDSVPSRLREAPRGLLIAVTVLAIGLAPTVPASPASTAVVLATTTSTQDSGRLDVLVPIFEQRSGVTVKTVAVGTGQALAMGARGEADVVLVHAPALERKSFADGSLVNPRLVMHNDFVVGPAQDPAAAHIS